MPRRRTRRPLGPWSGSPRCCRWRAAGCMLRVACALHTCWPWRAPACGLAVPVPDLLLHLTTPLPPPADPAVPAAVAAPAGGPAALGADAAGRGAADRGCAGDRLGALHGSSVVFVFPSRQPRVVNLQPASGRARDSCRAHQFASPFTPFPHRCGAGVRSNLPTSEPGVTQRVVYSWTLRLQGEGAGPHLHNCWLTEAVQPISQNLFGGL